MDMALQNTAILWIGLPGIVSYQERTMDVTILSRGIQTPR